MKINRIALSAMIASACLSGSAFGQTNRNAAPKYSPASYYSYYDEASPSTGKLASASSTKANSEVVQASATNCDNTKACDNTAACDSGKACDSAGGLGSGLGGALGGRLGRGCDNAGGGAAGCDMGSGAGGGCDSMCGSSGLFGMGILGTGRALNDPWKLFSKPIAGFNIGGWTSVGYHSYANPFSFNTYPKRLQLGQQWFYAEKVADGSNGLGLGGRVDYLYGTDAPDTQSFGIANNHWDNGWDNGAQYGHALPQAYAEAAYGDMSVKVGHFFTIVGNEVVAATGNFFYSRQFTFYNAEPFTHTGALTTYKVSDDTQLFNGYVMGWDSGFEDNGDAYIGGIKTKVSDRWTFLWNSVLGRFGEAKSFNAGERGGIQNVMLIGTLTDKLTYISQTDYLYTQNASGITARNSFGNINYLIYQLNDRWALGNRFEWFNFSGSGFGGAQNDDLYNFTTGVNYRAHANLLFRPEVRWVWDKNRYGFNEDNAGSQAAIGGDVVFTF
jgi:hypothetical protein